MNRGRIIDEVALRLAVAGIWLLTAWLMSIVVVESIGYVKISADMRIGLDNAGELIVLFLCAALYLALFLVERSAMLSNLALLAVHGLMLQVLIEASHCYKLPGISNYVRFVPLAMFVLGSMLVLLVRHLVKGRYRRWAGVGVSGSLAGLAWISLELARGCGFLRLVATRTITEDRLWFAYYVAPMLILALLIGVRSLKDEDKRRKTEFPKR